MGFMSLSINKLRLYDSNIITPLCVVPIITHCAITPPQQFVVEEVPANESTHPRLVQFHSPDGSKISHYMLR